MSEQIRSSSIDDCRKNCAHKIFCAAAYKSKYDHPELYKKPDKYSFVPSLTISWSLDGYHIRFVIWCDNFEKPIAKNNLDERQIKMNFEGVKGGDE